MKLDDFRERIPLEGVQLLPPISNPDKVVCVGMNYRDHCEEQNCPVPAEPIFFSKFASSLVGPNDSIPYPKMTSVSYATCSICFWMAFNKQIVHQRVT